MNKKPFMISIYNIKSQQTTKNTIKDYKNIKLKSNTVKQKSIMQPFLQHDQQFISSSSHNSQRKAHHLIDYLVSDVGITRRTARILVLGHECQTKTDVLELMTYDDNHKVKHIFIPKLRRESSLGSDQDHEEVQQCEVCSNPESIHAIVDGQLIQKLQHDDQFYQDELLQQQLFPSPQSMGMSRQVNHQQTIICQICYIDYPTHQISHFSSVTHSICIPCMTQYVDQKIASMEIESILCPHCGVRFTSQIVKQFASQKAFKIYQQFIKNLEIQKNPNLMWCPNSKCAVVISITNNKKVFSCPKCQFKICSKCKCQAHPKKSCNTVFQNEIKSWQNSDSIQRCKKCCSIVQKVSGCNHMSCSVCGHQWCWLCGANYSERHFNPMNPFGCAGMQNRDGIGKCRIWLWRVLLFFIMLIAIPVAFPFALIFSGPFVAIEAFYKRVQYNNNRFHKFLAVILGFFVGIIFDPIIWIGLVIVFGPRLCNWIREYFRNRRRRIQIADNRLTERLINDAIVNSQNIVFEGGRG